ncbi:DUF1361 domain-containing protein [Flaviramulus sp. BrNp1-15]|uniref:DUF1361 domain-containing protein n=1 Tax=Flaviramulus sp. BrNp1-15 TaxID=2916754 RepID=UPI001EE7FDAC|nr:DUF1361 domain-containing protein [Flaviramulus sp. BrNp1-15]ULC59017.1 DUF1361 domain-containing protein [Flaviramulus sp. BrNp1-15]
MDYIKQLLFSRFKTYALVSISMLLSIVLLMVRMKLTHSFYFLFLVWNLFLAVIPFAITSYLVSLPKLNKIGFVLCFSVWLLFLPNAPYIVTDLINLRLNYGYYIWLDVLLVSSFALNGLLLFFLSLIDTKLLLQDYFKKSITNYIITFILFLSGFGVYLGRFLRYNSWEILSNPKLLLIDILNIAIQPNTNKEAWLFTILFGTFLYIGFWVFKNLNYNI